jgi:hypothetical protein
MHMHMHMHMHMQEERAFGIAGASCPLLSALFAHFSLIYLPTPLSLSLTLSLSLSHTHTHTHTSLSLSLTHSPSLFLFVLSLSLSLSFSLSLSHLTPSPYSCQTAAAIVNALRNGPLFHQEEYLVRVERWHDAVKVQTCSWGFSFLSSTVAQ